MMLILWTALDMIWLEIRDKPLDAYVACNFPRGEIRNKT